MGADVPRSVASATRAVLGRGHAAIDWDVVYDRYARLLPRVRTRTRTLRPDLGDARRARHVARLRDTAATIASRRISSAVSSARILPGTTQRRLPHRAHLSRRFVESRRRIHRSPSPGLRRARRRRDRRRRRQSRQPRGRAAMRCCVNDAGRDSRADVARSRRSANSARARQGAARRSAAALSRVGRGQPPLRARAHRRPRRLPAHSRHGAVGLRRVPSRLSQRVRSQRA